MTKTPARLVADASRCDGHGICVLRCPDLLTLDAWGFVGVDSNDPLSGRDLRRAQSAVAACPEKALALLDVGVVTGERVLRRADSSAWNPRARGNRRLGTALTRSRPDA
jgi:ferredoxin